MMTIEKFLKLAPSEYTPIVKGFLDNAIVIKDDEIQIKKDGTGLSAVFRIFHSFSSCDSKLIETLTHGRYWQIYPDPHEFGFMFEIYPQ